MKTIITQNIDGHEIITGLYGAGGLIDPETTKKAVMKIIDKTDEWKEVEKLKKQITAYIYQAMQAKKNANQAFLKKNDADTKKFSAEANARWLQIKEIEEELKPLAVALQEKRKEMIRHNAIYFHPKVGEEFIEDDRAEVIKTAIQTAAQAGQRVTKNLEMIDDYRGRTFWKKSVNIWKSQEIFKLGEKPVDGAIEDKNLTDTQRVEVYAQIEKDRIAAMKPSARAIERDKVLARLKTQAAIMKNELEIDGDKLALKKAREWLAVETKKVEKRYK